MKRKTYLSELHAMLMERFPERVTIEQAAAMAGVSKTKLKADFQREYGKPFYSYFREERMKLAAKMLTETDHRIIDIASDVGYENCSKFAKAFRNVMGCSPSAYRQGRNKPVLFTERLAATNSVSGTILKNRGIV
ncbi:MAG: helix-turn-helix transcriptional regulator [Oscillospiraceae bacterium]|nr:helix-turn-helix transcriptional regulator [Oscillospiraceae bacterium]